MPYAPRAHGFCAGGMLFWLVLWICVRSMQPELLLLMVVLPVVVILVSALRYRRTLQFYTYGAITFLSICALLVLLLLVSGKLIRVG
jgi:hypothetical protein